MVALLQAVRRTVSVPYPQWVTPLRGARWDDLITVVAVFAIGFIAFVLWRKYRIPRT
jgi:hypothetical protein